jgi:glucosamine-phosphate N-acetyltransferase
MAEILVRKITESDLENGFLESLDSLRQASDIDRKKAKSILQKISQNPDHVIFVAVSGGRVVGATTLLIEQKFIHGGGKVGHIEDVVVSKDSQGSGIGEKIIRFVLDYAKKQGCYKTILDCDDKVKPFYEKIGFEAHSNGMRYDH